MLQGLEAGEIVVVTGNNELRDGQAVRVMNAGAAATEAVQGGGGTR